MRTRHNEVFDALQKMPDCTTMPSMREKIQAMVWTVLMVFNFAVIAQDSSPVQSDTLAQVEKAQRQHRSGVAGQVMSLDALFPNEAAVPEQSTVGIYVKGEKGKLRLKKKLETAADGTFYVDLSPGDYFIQPIITPAWWIEAYGLITTPVPVTIEAREITPVEVDIIATSGGDGVFSITLSASPP